MNKEFQIPLSKWGKIVEEYGHEINDYFKGPITLVYIIPVIRHPEVDWFIHDGLRVILKEHNTGTTRKALFTEIDGKVVMKADEPNSDTINEIVLKGRHT
jgi:hypothetical protein